jgi:NADH-quinone oxidoreductase subunit A
MDPSATHHILETSTGFFPFFLTLTLAAAVALVALALAVWVGPKRPSKEKNREYECGIRPDEPVHQRLDIQFYRMGILFLIFSVEVVFFFPWALALANGATRSDRILALIDMLVFVIIIVAGFVYAWAKGGFKWRRPYGETDRDT